MPNDLWPDDLSDPFAFNTPVAVFREQARLLAQHTGGQVTGSVDRMKSEADGGFRYSFNLVVPALSYRFCLFVIEYGVDGFPVYVIPDERIAEELELRKQAYRRQLMRYMKADSEGELLGILRNIFAAEKTKAIIRTLKAQAEEERTAN